MLTISSGGTVTLERLSGGPEVMAEDGAASPLPPALAAIDAAGLPRLGPHMPAGPVAVRGAMPGDVLEVRIEAVAPAADRGYCGHRPLVGTLPDEFDGRLPPPDDGTMRDDGCRGGRA